MADTKIMELEERIERLRSCLMNARNILKSGGYFYAKNIDSLLETLDKKNALDL